MQPSELTSALEAWQRQSSQTEDLQQAGGAAQQAPDGMTPGVPSVPNTSKSASVTPTLHDSPPLLGSGGASIADEPGHGPLVPPLSDSSSARERLRMRHNSMPTVPHSFWTQKRASQSDSNEAPHVPPNADGHDHSTRSAPESRVSLDRIQAHAAESHGEEVPSHGMLGRGNGEEQVSASGNAGQASLRHLHLPGMIAGSACCAATIKAWHQGSSRSEGC